MSIDLATTKEEYSSALYQTLLAILNSSGANAGDISVPRMALISQCRLKIDELLPQSEGVQFNLAGADSTNVLDLYLNSILDECARSVKQTAPIHILDTANGSDLSLEALDAKTGFIYLPNNYMRLVSFKIKAWLSEVNVAFLPTDPIYSRQKFTATRGGLARPVLILSSKIKTNNPVKQVDSITLSGASGSGLISGAGELNEKIIFNGTLAQSVTDFISTYAAIYLAKGIVLSQVGGKLIMTANAAGVGFMHPSIFTLSGDLSGAVIKETANIPAKESKRTLEYYSDPTEANELDYFFYVADEPAEYLQENLRDALTWMAASKLLQIWGGQNATYSEKAMEQVKLIYLNLK